MTRKRSVKFTVRWLAALKPPVAGQVDYFDTSTSGFGIRVSQGGSKTFYLMYRRDGRLKRFSVGRFPSISLADARKAASQIQANQEDPAGERRKERELGSFRELTKKYLAAAKLRDKTRVEWTRIVGKLNERFGRIPAGKLSKAQIREYLEEKAADAPISANRHFEVVRRIFTWGVEKEWVTENPCAGITKKDIGGRERSRERVLATTEIRLLWQALEVLRPAIAAFFRLLFYTGVRRGEALGVEWTHLDFEDRIWRIPTTKSGEPHEVPLTLPVVRLFESVRPLSGHSRYVFVGPTGKAIANPGKAKARLAKAAGFNDWTIHDIRRSVATGLASLGVSSDTVSAILNHQIGGSRVTRIYERYSRLPEKRAALERWAERLHQIVEGRSAKVVRFNG